MSLVGTWLLNESLQLPSSAARYFLNFTFLHGSSENNATSFDFTLYSSRIRLMYDRGYIIYAYRSSPAGYYYPFPEARFITITGGDDVENEDLVAWFETNAVRVEVPDYKVRYIELLLSADAIREKASSTSLMQWKTGTGYQDSINSIALGTDTSGGTALATDIMQGKIAYSKGEEIIGTLESANGVSF